MSGRDRDAGPNSSKDKTLGKGVKGEKGEFRIFYVYHPFDSFKDNRKGGKTTKHGFDLTLSVGGEGSRETRRGVAETGLGR